MMFIRVYIKIDMIFGRKLAKTELRRLEGKIAKINRKKNPLDFNY